MTVSWPKCNEHLLSSHLRSLHLLKASSFISSLVPFCFQAWVTYWRPRMENLISSYITSSHRRAIWALGLGGISSLRRVVVTLNEPHVWMFLVHSFLHVMLAVQVRISTGYRCEQQVQQKMAKQSSHSDVAPHTKSSKSVVPFTHTSAKVFMGNIASTLAAPLRTSGSL